jgi:hypothetical protein
MTSGIAENALTSVNQNLSKPLKIILNSALGLSCVLSTSTFLDAPAMAKGLDQTSKQSQAIDQRWGNNCDNTGPVEIAKIEARQLLSHSGLDLNSYVIGENLNFYTLNNTILLVVIVPNDSVNINAVVANITLKRPDVYIKIGQRSLTIYFPIRESFGFTVCEPT